VKVFQIGVYPPPIGGVSNHIQRLHAFLLERGVASTVVDLTGTPASAPGVVGRRAPWLVRFLWRQPAVLHFHVDQYRLIAVMYVLSFRHTVVYSLHNEIFIEEIDGLPRLAQWAVLRMLKRFHLVVGNSTSQTVVRDQLGLPRVRLVPQYIPARSRSDADEARVLAYRKRFPVLLSSNAFRHSFYRGEDMYGVDLLVEMVREVSQEHDVGMVFLLPGSGSEEYHAEIQRRIREYGIEDRFIFERTPLENASSLWRVSDLVIRATNTDGNSLTIHEALAEGTPVIASDCVPRPDGTILFRSRDADHLSQVVSETLADLNKHRGEVRALSVVNNATMLLDLYVKQSRLVA
jgi:glycosyltransferase involved in cell wall biosynthesis